MPETSIELDFADGSYVFRLGLAQIEELQRKCGIGIGALCARLLKGRYQIAGLPIGAINEAEFHVADVVEPIRQGLIGGGQGMVDGQEVKVSQQRANQLVEGYVLGQPLREAWTLSVAIVGALMEGYSPPKKAVPPEPAAPPKPTTRRKQKAGSITQEHSSTAP